MKEFELRKKQQQTIDRLKSEDKFVDAIEYGPDGEFIGIIYELNLDFEDLYFQKHFPKSVEYWKE